jgi:hypothetical protein
LDYANLGLTGKEDNMTTNKSVVSKIAFAGRTTDRKEAIEANGPNVREDRALNMTIISGEALDLPPSKHETMAVLV